MIELCPPKVRTSLQSVYFFTCFKNVFLSLITSVLLFVDRGSDAADPESVINARRLETNCITRWLKD